MAIYRATNSETGLNIAQFRNDMDSVGPNISTLYSKLARLLVIALFFFAAGSAAAQNDPFGLTDRIYVDSVAAGPGDKVLVKFSLDNDESISSLSLPIIYDRSLLTLTGLSFDDARTKYFTNKSVTPPVGSDTDGHFWVSLVAPFNLPLSSGDGTIFTAEFLISKSAPIGAELAIDSLFYPPGGELIMTEASAGAFIFPLFEKGEVSVILVPNNPPTISSTPDQYVFEGEQLAFDVQFNDPDNDLLDLVCTDKPQGATFVDNGNGSGTINWQPDYIGPNSADGSPFRVGFWVSDGKASTEQEVTIHVVNSNRKPSLSVTSFAEFDAGSTLNLDLSADDPDFDQVVLSVIDLPAGASFDYANPGHLTWTADVTDSGMFDITFVATDTYGAADSADLQVHINPLALWTIYADSTAGDPGETVPFAINLNNLQPVASFNILMHYDPTIITPNTLTNAGTRSESFEYFTYNYDDLSQPGNIRIIGIADQAGDPVTAPMAAGDGAVATMNMRISGNLAYSGYTTRTTYIFNDTEDNTMTDGSGQLVRAEDIEFVGGAITVNSIGTVKVGDINLNGVAFEISDATYFSNYLMRPFEVPMSPLQYANSDINHDNVAATLADLIALINVIVEGGNQAPKLNPDANAECSYSYVFDDDRITFSYNSDFELGGALLEFTGPVDINTAKLELPDEMIVVAATTEGVSRVLIYSLEGNRLPAGRNDFLTIEGMNEIDDVELSMATGEGQLVDVRYAKGSALPTTVVLRQNYPNPFNPETRIDFTLASATHVRLSVYNVLGREVNILLNDDLPAGTHSAMWNGTNGTGQSVASGIYYYRLETNDGIATRKMILLK